MYFSCTGNMFSGCETDSIHAAETKIRKQEQDLKYEESPFLAASGLPVFTKSKTTGVNGSYGLCFNYQFTSSEYIFEPQLGIGDECYH